MSMNSNRLPHQIFVWDSVFSKTHKDTWFNDLKQYMAYCELNKLFNTSTTDGLSAKFFANFAKNVMMDNFVENWKRDVNNMPKLRTFKLLHSNFETQSYSRSVLSRRSAFARMRSATCPLEIEILNDDEILILLLTTNSKFVSNYIIDITQFREQFEFIELRNYVKYMFFLLKKKIFLAFVIIVLEFNNSAS